MKFSIPDTRPFYDGIHQNPFGKEKFLSINPATEEVITEIPEADEKDVSAAVNAAQKAYEEWKEMDVIEKGNIISKIADAVEENADELIWLDVIDAGRPIVDAQEDIEAVVRMYRYFSGVPSKIEGSTIPTGNDKVVFTVPEPYGIIAAITAWNYPLFNETAKIAPIIATGNACILKPAEETPLVALRLAEIIANIPGIPKGLVSVLNGRGETTGELLVANESIRKVTFTGGTETGKAILNNISRTQIKGTTFELGGKSPIIVFNDANLDGAAKTIAFCGFFNQGQTCTAATRILVEKNVHDELISKIEEITKRIVIGDPFDTNTSIGPLVSETQYNKVRGYVERAIKCGEQLRFGGLMDKRKGFFVKPTLFDNVAPTSELFKDEIFGPVLTVTEFETLEEAISLANNSAYGLACGIWTKNIATMHSMISQINCGIVWCNTLFEEFPGAPAGGFKNSGYGREFGKEAITEYTQIKTMWVSADDSYTDWV